MISASMPTKAPSSAMVESFAMEFWNSAAFPAASVNAEPMSCKSFTIPADTRAFWRPVTASIPFSPKSRLLSLASLASFPYSSNCLSASSAAPAASRSASSASLLPPVSPSAAPVAVCVALA